MSLLVGIIIMGITSGDNIPLLLATGTASGILYLVSYVFFVQYSLAIIPAASASYFGLYAVQQGVFNAHPYAVMISSGSIVIMLFLSWYWSMKLAKN